MNFASILNSTVSASESGIKQENTNVDRVFHGYNQHHHHPYDQTQMGMGMGMYIPSYQMYGHNQGYGVKLGETGHTSYGGYQGGSGSGNGGGSHAGYSYGSMPRHKKKGQATALSALTLLAFLFFLNLLQNCLKEHMMSMNPTVMVMTAGVGKEGYENLERTQLESRLMLMENEDDYYRINKSLKNEYEDKINKTEKSIAPRFENIFNEQLKRKT